MGGLIEPRSRVQAERAKSGWASRKALIKVGYGCNEHCTFCHTQDVRHIDGESAEVVAKIHRAHALGHGMVVFSGGEPTIRPELLDWAALVARLGMDVGLVTNGLVLAYPEMIDKLLSRRLRYVYMSLHGVGRVHNRLVRSDSWEAAHRAVQNLSDAIAHGAGGRGPRDGQGALIELTVNCVVTHQNLEHLVPLVDALLPYPDLLLKFSMVQPKGGGKRLFDALTPKVSDVGERVARAIRHGIEQVRARGARGPRFGHDGIPHCVLPGLERLFDDLKTHRFATMSDIGEPDFFPVDEALNVQPEEPCSSCSLRGPCPGLFRGYVEQIGVAELAAPPPAPRSNSFTWTFESQVASEAPADHCPLRDGELGIRPWDRGRELFVRNAVSTPAGRRFRIARFRTDTRDFADVEISAIKHELGQAYLDVSNKPAPDDFARDLRPLVRSSLCEGCEHAPRCTGMFEPALGEDRFTRDDAKVRAVLESLSGDVLDVGCGEGPYSDLWAPMASAGRIRYVGVDPHADLESLGRRWPWATLVRGDGETIELGDRRFAAVLILRSWNHLRDPRAAVARLISLLDPGGSFLVVDNVAFGLARTRAQAHVAERSSAGFEHYRNDGASEAHRAITSVAADRLELVERHDVSASVANQWLLRYRRR